MYRSKQQVLTRVHLNEVTTAHNPPNTSFRQWPHLQAVPGSVCSLKHNTTGNVYNKLCPFLFGMCRAQPVAFILQQKRTTLGWILRSCWAKLVTHCCCCGLLAFAQSHSSLCLIIRTPASLHPLTNLQHIMSPSRLVLGVQSMACGVEKG